jgi:hypothetical protein
MTIQITDPSPADLLLNWRRRGPVAQDSYNLREGKRYVAVIMELDTEAAMSTIENALETEFEQVAIAKGIAEYTTPSGIPENTQLRADVRLRISLESLPPELEV